MVLAALDLVIEAREFKPSLEDGKLINISSTWWLRLVFERQIYYRYVILLIILILMV